MKFKKVSAIVSALMLTLSAIPFGGMISSFAKTIEDYSVGDIIEFGTYPQTKVTDTSLILSLDGISKSWISYGYYSGTDNWADGKMTSKDYMKYADINYNDNKYRAVIFTAYRPYHTGYTSSESNSKQDDNGYYTDRIYYFKYEPLKWQILDPAEGYVMCESIIDSQAYNNYIKYYNSEYYGNSSCTSYASDYANSSIRQWLNNDFYNTAFSSSEKSTIVTSHYENKSTADSTFDSLTTYDKITILSDDDVTNSNYGFDSTYYNYDNARVGQGTDYAKCQGLYVYTGSSFNSKSYFRLRSPYGSFGTRDVGYDGRIHSGSYCDFTDYGIRPAFKLNPASSPKVYFNSNGGEIEGSNNRDVVCGKAYGTLPSPIRKGYTFDGWYTEKEGGTKVTASTTVTNPSTHTLYAHWKALVTKVIFDAKGGMCSISNKNVTYKEVYGELPVPTRDGYEFLGWFSQEAGGSMYTKDTVCYQLENKTLYAHWKSLKTKVYLNSNGGEFEGSNNKDVVYGRTYETLPSPIRKGYTFDGWYTEKEGGTKVTASTIVSNPNTHTLYAHWKKITNKNVYSVSISDFELKYKKSEKISPSINADSGADYTVSYSSSNEKVATVDQNGKVYGAKRGDATITCTVTDSIGNKVSDTCNVEVKYSFGQWLIKILLFGWIWY